QLPSGPAVVFERACRRQIHRAKHALSTNSTTLRLGVLKPPLCHALHLLGRNRSADVRLVANYSNVVHWRFQQFGRTGPSLSGTSGSPLKHRSGKPARGEREAGEHSPRDGFRDESVVGWPPKPVADRFL